MDKSKLYDAIVRGDDESFEGLISADENLDWLLRLATMYGRTRIAEKILERCPRLLTKGEVGYGATRIAEKILEICPRLQNKGALVYGVTRIAERILERCPPLVTKRGPGCPYLNLAARYGQLQVAQMLVKRAEQSGDKVLNEILEREDQNKDTALHVAVRSGCFEMVVFLTSKNKTLSQRSNGDGDSPLFLAVSRNFEDIAWHILSETPQCSSSGRDSMNVLHAAVINDNIGIVKHMMRYSSTLTKQADNSGRFPIHYAACMGRVEMVETFISSDGSLAYMLDEQDMSPVQLAAKNRQVSVVEVLFREHPLTCRLSDKKGRNVFHTAVETGERTLVELLLSSDFSVTFVNETDEDGNTPLHLAAKLEHAEIIKLLADDPKVDKTSSNSEGLTTYDIITSSKKLSPDDKKVITAKCNARGQAQAIRLLPEAPLLEGMKSLREKFAEFNLLVATIIATATFAAGFTMPGGYIQSGQDGQGMAVLAKRSAFRAFVVADAVAFGLSSSSICLIFFILTSYKGKHTQVQLLTVSYILTYSATIAFIVAFLCGIYVTLEANRRLAISAIVTSVSVSLYLVGYLFMTANQKLKTSLKRIIIRLENVIEE